MGLGKERSRYGEFLDKHGVRQEEIVSIGNLNRETVTKACRESDPKFREITKDALVEAANKRTGKRMEKNDFWPM